MLSVAWRSALLSVVVETWLSVTLRVPVVPCAAVADAVTVRVSAAVSTTRVVGPKVRPWSPVGSVIGSLLGAAAVRVSLPPDTAPASVVDPRLSPSEFRNCCAPAEIV